MYKLYYCTFILFIYLSDASIVRPLALILKMIYVLLYIFSNSTQAPEIFAYTLVHVYKEMKRILFYFFQVQRKHMCDLDILKYMKFFERNKQKKNPAHTKRNSTMVI